MEARIDKKTYIKIVKHSLESMIELANEDKTYDLESDTYNYYITKVKKDDIITADEFIALCKEVGINMNKN